MDRIKSQREEWVNSHSVLEVGETTLPGQPGVHRPLSQGQETVPSKLESLKHSQHMCNLS